MNKDFISFEQALELKELGFDDDCLGYYNIDPNAAHMPFLCIYKPYKNEFCLHAPIYQQAFRWFREKHGIMYTVHNNIENWKNTFHGAYSKINSNYESDYTDDYATYEEAELACLKKLIEIVKKY
jgi:hypothetical protein